VWFYWNVPLRMDTRLLCSECHKADKVMRQLDGMVNG